MSASSLPEVYATILARGRPTRFNSARRICWVASIPSITGMQMSMRMRSKCRSCASATALAPLHAVVGTMPKCDRRPTACWRFAGTSSTTMTCKAEAVRLPCKLLCVSKGADVADASGAGPPMNVPHPAAEADRGPDLGPKREPTTCRHRIPHWIAMAWDSAVRYRTQLCRALPITARAAAPGQCSSRRTQMSWTRTWRVQPQVPPLA